MSKPQLLKPWLASLEDEVGGLDQLSHDGDDGDLAGFFAGDESAEKASKVGLAGSVEFMSGVRPTFDLFSAHPRSERCGAIESQ